MGVLLVVLLVVSLPLALVACDGHREKPYTIVYIGDSIAEALIGPSPLSERDNYGYYAIVGRINNFRYYNHAVSGHKTSTGIVSGDGLLEMLLRDNDKESAVLMKTHIEQADMVHISVLGNNILQYNLGLMMLEIAYPDFEQKYQEGDTLINALEEGRTMFRDSVELFDANGNPKEVKFDFPSTYQDICDIVDRIKELNPKATIVFQKVYNPFFDGSKHLSSVVRAKLAQITDESGRFGEAGKNIDTIEQIRALADTLLGYLNGMLDKYLEEHPGAITILDAGAAFEEVVQRDKNDDGSVNLAEDCLGRQLIYQDWTHPSNFGHAVIAGCTQDLLDEMGISSSNAISAYKEIKIDQINRLFKPIEDFDAQGAIDAINAADTFLDVTLAYFKAIDYGNITPIY